MADPRHLAMIRNYIQPNTDDEDIRNLYGGNERILKRLKYLRTVLLVFLCIVFVGGMAILGIGIWTLEAEYGSKQLSKLIDANLYKVDSYLMIITGAAILAITLLGFCGVFTRYKCIMGLHLGLLAFMSVMLFVAGILGYALLGELEDKVKGKMEVVVVEHYGINLDTNAENRRLTTAWDDIQQTFDCCGAFGDVNSSTSWALFKEKSQWVKLGMNNNSLVPDSCCQGSKNMDQCTGRISGVGPPSVGPPVTINVNALMYTIFTQGCYDALQVYLTYTGVVIGTSAIVVGVFLLVELALSICLYRTLVG